MSSRNPPSDPGESHYTPKDRSPPRFAERRPSASYSGGPLTARTAESGHRSIEAHGYPHAGREPPKAPKALLGGPRPVGYGSRGRGFADRGEARSRDIREVTDESVPRRGVDRDWNRRGRVEGGERRTSSAGRARSRSPLPRGCRESKDSLPREPETNRVRGGSRDGPLSTSSSTSDAVPPSSLSNTGIVFGRSRGDRELGKSSRATYPDERAALRNRSRSRGRIWEKKGLEERDQREADFGRRNEDARKEPDERERETERHKREMHAFRPDTGNPTGAPLTPVTPLSASALSSQQMNADRSRYDPQEMDTEPIRFSGSITPSIISSRDPDRNDLLLQRTERDRQARITSPPPQAPQVPAFGSIADQSASTGQSRIALKKSSKDEVSQAASYGAVKEVPSGLKARPLGHAPTGPKATQPQERHFENLGIADAMTDADRDRYGSMRGLSSGTENKTDEETRRVHQSMASTNSSQFRAFHENIPRARTSFGASHALSNQSNLPVLQPTSKRDLEKENRSFNPAFASSSAVFSKGTVHDAPNLFSPVKIPTGPRADRSVSANRPPASPPVRGPPTRPSITLRPSRPANWRWVRPDLPQHTPRGPSIMNTVPTKRDYAGEDKQRAGLPHRESPKLTATSKLRSGPRSKDLTVATNQASDTHPDDATQQSGAGTEKASGNFKDEIEVTNFQRPVMSVSEVRKGVDSNDVDVDVDVEDGLMEFDDEEFAEDERKFALSMQALSLKRPATPRHHPLLLSLLDELDALASAAEDLTGGLNGEHSTKQESAVSLPLGLPSPKLEDVDKPDLNHAPMSNVPPTQIRHQTPSVESLPFLVSGPPTPFSDIEEVQQVVLRSELVHARILDMLSGQQERLEAENEEIRLGYAKGYKNWMMKVDEYEDQRRAENPATPAPTSPIPAALPLATAAIEGRRPAKNTSEFDLERVLRESAVTAQEDQERRNRESKSFINLEKEAEIPKMLSKPEVDVSKFDDWNNLIETRLAFEAFVFVPPEDNFTAEEREIFMDSYLQFPKKWGAIAEALPGRNYQDCIQHYYHTKGEAQYKEREKIFSRNKKGRRGGRAQQPRPKPNALMPSYDGSGECETPQIPVTDTGRPRRAAAPTFGDVVDGETVPAVATPVRRNAPGAKPETIVEATSEKEKPVNKRSRTASVKEKPPKKGKAPLLAAAPPPLPLKGDRDTIRAKSREPKIEGDQRMEEIAGAQLLAGFHNSQSSLGLGQPGLSDTWLGIQPSFVNVSSQIPNKQPQPSQEAQLHAQLPKSSQPATSSYWSVPEQTDFQNLVQHFGTDFHAIADHMKSKTHTMVCLLNSYLELCYCNGKYADEGSLARSKTITFDSWNKVKPRFNKRLSMPT